MSKTIRRKRVFKVRSQGISLEQIKKTILLSKSRKIEYGDYVIADIPGIVDIALVKVGRKINNRTNEYTTQKIVAISPKAIVTKDLPEEIEKYLRKNEAAFYCIAKILYPINTTNLFHKIVSSWRTIHCDQHEIY